MNRKPRRIDISLFDDELKSLINASAKIFPLSQAEIDSNFNPNNYEYARVGNQIYRWDGAAWKYIIADDIDINWSEIKDKPTKYTPSTHTHTELDITNLDKYSKGEVDTKLSVKADKIQLHSHDNKSLIDTITQSLIDAWDSAVTHISDLVRHVTQDDKNKWNTVTNKADTSYVDTELGKKSNTTHNHDTVYDTITSVNTKLSSKSDVTHNHDGAYYKKSDVDSKLSNKSDITHKHTEADITDLNKYTKLEVDTKLSAKAEKVHTHSESDITSIDKYTKAETNTLLDAKSNTGHKHVEADISDLDKYTKGEVDTKLATKSNTGHTHTDLHVHNNKSLLDKLIETSVNATYDLSNLDYIDAIRQGYTEGHAHSNLTVLTGITAIKVDGWDGAVTHISDNIKHITAAERTLWNTVSSKSSNTHNHDTVYSLLTHNHDTVYSALSHTHDDRYFTETEINTKLSGKSDTSHTHADKADKTYVDTELGKKLDSETFSYHINTVGLHVTTVEKNKWNAKAELSDIPTTLPANGGNADTVGGFTVGISVPAGAKFTDTIYTHPATHAASMIVESTTKRFVSDAEKATWNAKSEFSGSYVDLSNKPTIPTSTSQLTNNSGFITISSVPTQLSQLTNNTGFITINDVPKGVTISALKPSDGSMWYKVIG